MLGSIPKPSTFIYFSHQDFREKKNRRQLGLAYDFVKRANHGPFNTVSQLMVRDYSDGSDSVKRANHSPFNTVSQLMVRDYSDDVGKVQREKIANTFIYFSHQDFQEKKK